MAINLGTFELTDTVTIYFQFVDNTLNFDNADDVPQWIIYDDAGAAESAAFDMSAVGPTGLYYAVIDLDDYNPAHDSLAAGNKYVIHVTTTDQGASTSEFYYFEVVAAGTTDQLANSKIKDLHDDLHSAITTAGDIDSLIENSVWDADATGHVGADTFGSRTFTEDNIADTLSALAITGGFTAGNDLSTLADKIGDIEPAVLGRWKIDPVAKTLTFYEMDGVTELTSFDLKDSAGDPSTTNVHERTPQ